MFFPCLSTPLPVLVACLSFFGTIKKQKAKEPACSLSLLQHEHFIFPFLLLKYIIYNHLADIRPLIFITYYSFLHG